MNRKYELVYVVSPDASDDQVAGLHTQVEETVSRMGAEIEKTDNWGRRRLAYEIGRHKDPADGDDASPSRRPWPAAGPAAR